MAQKEERLQKADRAEALRGALEAGLGALWSGRRGGEGPRPGRPPWPGSPLAGKCGGGRSGGGKGVSLGTGDARAPSARLGSGEVGVVADPGRTGKLGGWGGRGWGWEESEDTQDREEKRGERTQRTTLTR